MTIGSDRFTVWLESHPRGRNARAYTALTLQVTTSCIALWEHGRSTPSLRHALALERLTGIPSTAWAEPADPAPAADPQ